MGASTPSGRTARVGWHSRTFPWMRWRTGSPLPTMGRPVIDRTGLAGAFSFRANLFGLEKGAPPEQLKRTMVNDDAGDTLRATLPEQLGLKLDAQKAPIEFLVIDRAEKVPTAN